MLKKIIFCLPSFLLILAIGCQKNGSDTGIDDNRSIFLMQMRDSKVQWRRWSAQTLKSARAENKLIFISLGYGTSFSCRKMDEHFKDSTIVELLNKNFVSIRIDREDRPDLDSYFLNLQSQMMGYAAWPMNMILSPDQLPLFTSSLVSKPVFKKILQNTLSRWVSQDPKWLEKSHSFLVGAQSQPNKSQDSQRDYKIIDDFYAIYTHNFDPIHGGRKVGKGFAPKFPINNDLRLLLRYHHRKKIEQPLKMVEKTLTEMMRGAFFDHLDGGVHRYSLSRDWNTPNHEKILVDQAGFIHTLLQVYKFTKKDRYRRAAEKSIQFLLRRMLSPFGGFYSSLSGQNDLREGFYYTWQEHEIQSSLSKKEFSRFKEYYFLNRRLPRYSQRRTLRRKTSFDKKDIQEIEEKLRVAREKKGKLIVDNKVVTSFNSQILAVLSQVERAWPSQDFKKLIEDQIGFILRQHRNRDGELYRRSIKGETRLPPVLDDYAFLIHALIEFYQTSFDEKYLWLAMTLQEKQDSLFLAQSSGLYFFNQKSDPVVDRLVLFKDQNVASGQALSYFNLLRLGFLLQDSLYFKKANQLVEAYPDQLALDPLSYPSLLLALDFDLSNPRLLIIQGNKKQCEKYVRVLEKDYRPGLLYSCASQDSSIDLNRQKRKLANGLNFYLCTKTECSPPIGSFDGLLSQLNQ